MRNDPRRAGPNIGVSGVITESHYEPMRVRRWRWLPWPKKTVEVKVITGFMPISIDERA